MMPYINQNNNNMDRLSEARRVFDIEINALQKTRDALSDVFLQILDLITNCEGKVIVTGVGKPGHIAGKLAATFASLGTPAFKLHPAEAMHGDLGMVSANDILIAISFSGESDEIIRILPNIKMIGAKIIGLTGNPHSTLARTADIIQILPEFKEACPLGLAPTSSTTAALCYGDSLAIVASRLRGFQVSDFGMLHPAGSIGKKIIATVDDLMRKGEENSVVYHNDSLRTVIVELSKKGLGIVSIIDYNGSLLGVITDGDLRRKLEQEINIYEQTVDTIMTKTPIIIESGKLAIDALNIMKDRGVSCMPVISDKSHVIGTIRIHDIIRYGIVP